MLKTPASDQKLYLLCMGEREKERERKRERERERERGRQAESKKYIDRQTGRN